MAAVDLGYGWGGEQLDLDAYLARIGWADGGAPEPTEAALRRLHAAHVTTIPFENLEIPLGRPILLDLDSIQSKLVRRPRGGYCYEHVQLFAAVLERLGFGVTGLAARVRMGVDRQRPRTHALLRVETAETAATGRVWLCDVGFGGSPLAPIELVEGATTSEGGWSFRLDRARRPDGTEEWALRSLRADGPLDLHGFSLDPQYPVDYVVSNHYISTHPRSPFVNRATVQRAARGIHRGLDGTTFTTTHPDGSKDVRQVPAGEVPETLARELGVELDAADAATLVAWLTARQAEG